MTPIKAFAWTLAWVWAGSCAFGILVSLFVDAGYRYWFVDLLFLCMLAPLSWDAYRRYRKGSMYSSFTKLPKHERRVGAIVGVVIFVCCAALQIVRAWSALPDSRLGYLATASVWLVLGAERFRRYLELRRPEISSSQ
jgi:hypothetical protein